jgi:anti-sigma B factor antagonist
MQLTLTSQDDTATCVAVQGDISQSRFPSHVNDPMEHLLGGDCHRRNVLVDLSEAGFIDSSGVGWLMTSHKRFIAAGGRLILHSMPPTIGQVIQLLRLNTILTIKPDQAAALAAVSQGKSQ